MNILTHFRKTRTAGICLAFLVMLPDLFVLIRKLVPIPRIQRFCLRAHNTKEAIDMAARLNKTLGQAWEVHRQQDMDSHERKYKYESGENSDARQY